ncbi:GNAT family N-acetyltransferase [Orrella sp. JC864]|uniref:GNAT family N-acetyltransferase n=1 Tax=Orrella sp. JC864 TaxID=3120298 RepID=UPI0012BCE960
MQILLNLESPQQPDVRQLLQRSTDYLMALYPPESCILADEPALLAPGARFWVARQGARPVGCCALLPLQPGRAEIKRLYVDEPARGAGLGSRLLLALERQAARDGVATVLLETGVRQPEALGLYRKHGYVERGPYGPYRPDPLSIFMEKRLADPA